MTKCLLPLCKYEAFTVAGWGFCASCMIKTIRRILADEGLWPQAETKIMPTDPALIKRTLEIETWVIANQDILATAEGKHFIRRRTGALAKESLK